MSSSVSELAALGKLFEEHRPKLLAMLERRIDPALRKRLEPAEVLQEAFLAAQYKWRRFRAAPSAMTPHAWLYRVVLDTLIEIWRKQSRDRRNPAREMPWPEQSSIQLGLGLLNSGTSPSEAFARKELQERMRHALEGLGPRDREILWMRHYDDLSFSEAAAVLGITENAATVRYVRALKRLKTVWQRVHGDSAECL